MDASDGIQSFGVHLKRPQFYSVFSLENKHFGALEENPTLTAQKADFWCPSQKTSIFQCFLFRKQAFCSFGGESHFDSSKS
jgi:hypothetical protein